MLLLHECYFITISSGQKAGALLLCRQAEKALLLQHGEEKGRLCCGLLVPVREHVNRRETDFLYVLIAMGEGGEVGIALD